MYKYSHVHEGLQIGGMEYAKAVTLSILQPWTEILIVIREATIPSITSWQKFRTLHALQYLKFMLIILLQN